MGIHLARAVTEALRPVMVYVWCQRRRNPNLV
jgi:hypothetical protein